jgi:carbon monoxide dehydrogenase subunit G
MELRSDTRRIEAPAEKVYDFLTDFNNFGHLLPEQVKEWDADTTHCSFLIEGLPRISLKLGECTEARQVIYLPGTGSPVDFSLRFEMKPLEEGHCEMVNHLEADISPMIAMMAKRPLQHFLDLISEKLSDHMRSMGNQR